jgi:hypothetical protein
MINDKNDVKKADLKLKKSFNKNINEFNENKIKIISQKKFLDNYKKKLIDKIEENLKNKKLIHFYSESKNKNENENKDNKENETERKKKKRKKETEKKKNDKNNNNENNNKKKKKR